VRSVMAADLDRVAGGRREDLCDGWSSYRDVEFFNAALAQLRIAHDLRDDPVGMLDFLLDDLDLLGDFEAALLEGALEGKAALLMIASGFLIWWRTPRRGGRRNAIGLRGWQTRALPLRPSAGVSSKTWSHRTDHIKASKANRTNNGSASLSCEAPYQWHLRRFVVRRRSGCRDGPVGLGEAGGRFFPPASGGLVGGGGFGIKGGARVSGATGKALLARALRAWAASGWE